MFVLFKLNMLYVLFFLKWAAFIDILNTSSSHYLRHCSFKLLSMIQHFLQMFHIKSVKPAVLLKAGMQLKALKKQVCELWFSELIVHMFRSCVKQANTKVKILSFRISQTRNLEMNSQMKVSASHFYDIIIFATMSSKTMTRNIFSTGQNHSLSWRAFTVKHLQEALTADVDSSVTIIKGTAKEKRWELILKIGLAVLIFAPLFETGSLLIH